MSEIFRGLDNETTFTDFVANHFRSAPRELTVLMKCQHFIADDRIAYAHQEYLQNIQKFSLLLNSADPDHYKRSGALLHALYQSEIVTDLLFEYSTDDIETGFSRVPHQQTQDFITFLEFYEEYYNEFLSFDIAFRICAMHEDFQPKYDFNYVHTCCVFLKNNPNLSVDAFFMLFKSLMYRSAR